MDIIPFRAEHLYDLDLQDGQAYLSSWITPDQAGSLEEHSFAYTGTIDGQPIGSAGVLPLWEGRGIAWAYISKDAAGARFMAVHKSVKRFLDGCTIKRIEMTVDCEFEPGHRWAKMLGFTMEAERMSAYRPDGGDCALYAKVS